MILRFYPCINHPGVSVENDRWFQRRQKTLCQRATFTCNQSRETIQVGSSGRSRRCVTLSERLWIYTATTRGSILAENESCRAILWEDYLGMVDVSIRQRTSAVEHDDGEWQWSSCPRLESGGDGDHIVSQFVLRCPRHLIKGVTLSSWGGVEANTNTHHLSK